ncbi:hypothetical protein BBDE_0285 [Bifidobacterium dentium JCM 1195 = DSM 20436]|uniref:Uncharacterized protein n=1 Tax=Bifidobacterium dentium (strain ATCC 27534 / DSM 20436 / JCM 1195 / Bd1) TaxID=401473 RepID=D2Q842_BIFDB|nr:hypothetical protein BDP_0298 [Bifidobacterium dentium Bd1]BAQ26279.1 hypothetical protein BBDE_0285 [Bifidobacterium dentium JCM 1195 = DSM 20436]
MAEINGGNTWWKHMVDTMGKRACGQSAQHAVFVMMQTSRRAAHMRNKSEA